MREWLARLWDWRRRRVGCRRAAGSGSPAGQPDSGARSSARSLVVAWLDHLVKDLRFALRGLRRSPGFTGTVILTLGLGPRCFSPSGCWRWWVAAVDWYGVIGYQVAQRMHELRIRTALGAGALDLVRLVVGQGLFVAIVGVVAGSLAALATSGSIEPLLFAEPATDPVIYGAVAGLLLAVSLVASAVPAARATRADPNTALRSD